MWCRVVGYKLTAASEDLQGWRVGRTSKYLSPFVCFAFSSTLKVDAIFSSEEWIKFCQNALLRGPENITVRRRRCENNKSNHNFSSCTSPLRKLATLIIQDAENVFAFYPFFLVILSLSRFLTLDFKSRP